MHRTIDLTGTSESAGRNPDNLSLAQLFDLYRRARLRGKSHSAVYQYGLNLRRLAACLGRVPLLSDLSDDTIADAMEWLVRTRKLSASSANKLRDNLCALWRFAVNRRLVDLPDPEIDELPEPVRIPIAWTMEQLRQLWEVCRSQRGLIGGVPARDWWIALHCVMWDTAERIGALVQVEWSDVDLGRGYITVRAEDRKGKRSDHLSKLHPDTISCLQMIRNPSRRLVFPWTFHWSYLWTKYRRMRLAAGMPVDRDHSFHCMRKSAASWLEAAGGNAQLMLGHTTREMTLKYLDPRIVSQRGPCDLLPRPDRPGGADPRQ